MTRAKDVYHCSPFGEQQQVSYLKEVLRRLRVEPHRIRSNLIGRSLDPNLVGALAKSVDLSDRLIDRCRVRHDRCLKIVDSCHDFLPLLGQLVEQSKQAPKSAPAPTTLKVLQYAHGQ